jgi:L,D-transpeptidase-like protein
VRAQARSRSRRTPAAGTSLTTLLAAVAGTVLVSLGAATDASASSEPDNVWGTPCTSSARACVDLDSNTAWLIDDGEIVRGPVAVRLGDAAHPTPDGTFHIRWKAAEYLSHGQGVAMPYPVFADGGFAFHEGRQDTPSTGFVKMRMDDAHAWFDFLAIGDEVQLH